MSLKMRTTKSIDPCLNSSAGSDEKGTAQIADLIRTADAVLIGAGAGLSTAAGFIYSGARLRTYFGDFVKKYGFENMYEGGFYPFSGLEEHWAYWSRYIYINRYMDAPLPIYENLFALVKNKDYFVLTTNVDHCFQKAGFAKERLFYTQGDFGLFQCSKPCHDRTYDNEETIRKMVLSQGFSIADNKELIVPDDLCSPTSSGIKMTVSSELLPVCPVCGRPMSMNLRADGTFVQDAGWEAHAKLYDRYLHTHKDSRIVFLELGVGFNTPGIIKYPFWEMTQKRQNASYVCLNFNEAFAPDEIRERSVCINEDIGAVLKDLLGRMSL